MRLFLSSLEELHYSACQRSPAGVKDMRSIRTQKDRKALCKEKRGEKRGGKGVAVKLCLLCDCVQGSLAAYE